MIPEPLRHTLSSLSHSDKLHVLQWLVNELVSQEDALARVGGDYADWPPHYIPLHTLDPTPPAPTHPAEIE